jgi:hypothetical protein
MPTNKKAVRCVAYTGIGAKPSGVHTPKEFLATTKNAHTKMMCNEANKGRRKMTGKSTIDEKVHTFSIPKCPKKTDVKGWMKWTGANSCTKTQEKELKKV